MASEHVRDPAATAKARRRGISVLERLAEEQENRVMGLLGRFEAMGLQPHERGVEPPLEVARSRG